MMSKREKVIGIILLALAVLCAFVFFSRQSRPPAATGKFLQDLVKDAPPQTAGPETLSNQGLKRMIEKVFLKFKSNEPAGDIVDPFKKFDAKDLMDRNVLQFSELKLIGIVLDKEVPAALINDQILYPGDQISGFKVVEIHTNEVVLTRGLEKYILKLFEEP